MPRKPSSKTVAEAKDIVSGVRTIAKNEQLLRGSYVTDKVKTPALAAEGAICGGHKACLLGSIALADPTANFQPYLATIYADRLSFTPDPSYITSYHPEVRPGPAARLVHSVFSDIAKARIERAAKTGPYPGTARRILKDPEERSFESWAETYFEEYLKRASKGEIHEAVLSLCTAATRKLNALAA